MTEPSTFENGQIMQITPRSVALQRTVNSTLSSSVEIELNTNTRIIRCYATVQDVYLRWGIENCNANTFDEVIPAGQVVDLAVPSDSNGRLFTHINLIERTSGATIIVIEK